MQPFMSVQQRPAGLSQVVATAPIAAPIVSAVTPVNGGVPWTAILVGALALGAVALVVSAAKK